MAESLAVFKPTDDEALACAIAQTRALAVVGSAISLSKMGLYQQTGRLQRRSCSVLDVVFVPAVADRIAIRQRIDRFNIGRFTVA